MLQVVWIPSFFLRLPQLSSGYKTCIVLFLYKLNIHGAILLQKQLNLFLGVGDHTEWNESLEAIIRLSSYLSICTSPSLIISPTIQHKIPSQKLQAKFSLHHFKSVIISVCNSPSLLSLLHQIPSQKLQTQFFLYHLQECHYLSVWSSPSLITSPAVLYQIHSQKLHSLYHFLHALNYTTTHHHHCH